MIRRGRQQFATYLLAPLFLWSLKAGAACTSPAAPAGKLNYNSTYKTWEYCNNTNWVDARKSDPIFVAQVTDTSFLNTPVDVEISGNYAYVTSSSSTIPFVVFDITDINNPTIVGQIYNAGFNLQNLVVSGTTAYAVQAASDRLYVIDITTPTAPAVITSITSSTQLDGAEGLFKSGNYLYITAPTDDMLTIVDVSTPSSPTVVGTVTDATQLDDANAVYVSGSYAYVTGGNSDRFTIVDVSNPASPSIVSSLTSATALDDPSAVYVSGNTAFVTTLADAVITSINITNKNSPTILQSLLIGAPGSQEPVDICAAADGTLAIPQGGANWSFMSHVDVSDPSNMYLIDLWAPTYAIGTGSHCSISGNTLMFTNLSSDTVYTSDITAKDALYKTELLELYGGDNYKWAAVAVSGNYAFTVEEHDFGRFFVTNISTPSAPTVSKVLQDQRLQFAFDVAVSGNYAYVTASAGLVVVDITTPTAPAIVATLTDSSITAGKSISISGNYAFITSPNRLSVVDVSTPTSPTLSGSISDTTNLSSCFDNDVSGNYVFVACSSSRLTVVDVTTKTSPTVATSLLDTTNLSGTMGIDVSGSYAYMTAQSQDRLTVVNISTPTSPSVAGSVQSATNLDAAQKVIVSGNYAYVTAYNANRLTVVDITTPSAPSVAGSVTGASLNDAWGIALSGSYVLVSGYLNGGGGWGSAQDLTLVDVSTPSAPTVAGSTGYEGPFHRVTGIEASGNYLIVTNDRSTGGEPDSLTIIDASDKTTMTVTIAAQLIDSTYLSNPIALAVSGNYAYVMTSGARLTVVDISNKSSPSVVGSVTNANLGSSGRITVSGNYVYAGVGNLNRLTIIDVTTKTSPTIAGSVQDNTNLIGANGVSVSGNYAYVASTTSDSLTVVDISNPASPSVVTSVTSAALDIAKRLDISGNYAYVCSGNASPTGVTAIDISTPGSPVIKGTYVLSQCTDVKVVGTTAYVLSGSAGVINHIDFSNPNSPFQVTQASLNGGSGSGGNLAIDSNYVYAATISYGAIHIFKHASKNVSVAAKANFNDNQVLYSSASRHDIAVQGNYAYLTSYNNDNLAVLDISNPASPTIVGRVFSNLTLELPDAVAVSGNYAYAVSNGNDRLTVIDVSTPTAPVIVTNLTSATTLDGANGIYISGNYAYVTASADDMLTVVNISTPTSPSVVGSVASTAMMDAPIGIVVAGNYAYVNAIASNKFAVVDVSNPASPSVVGGITDATKLAGGSGQYGIAKSGNYVYVTAGTLDRFNVIDVSTPSSPSIVASLQDSTYLDGAWDVKISGNYAYVTTTTYQGIAVVDITTPTSPYVVGRYKNTAVIIPSALQISGTKLYVSGTVTTRNFAVFDLPTFVGGACSTSSSALEYDFTNNVYRFCDGAVWNLMGTSPGAGGSGCSSPTGKRGALDYFSATNVYKYCDGTNWVTVD